MSDEKQQNISFAEFELDQSRRVLRRAGKPVAMNARTFDLLAYLAENSGRVVTKDEILEAVWEGNYVEEANLSVQISTLRKILGERRDAPRFLVTVPGKGYKFIAEVERDESEIVIEKHKFSRLVFEEEGEKRRKGDGELISSSSNISLSPFLPFSLSRKTIIVGLLTLLAAAAGVFWFFNRTTGNHGTVIPVSAAGNEPRLKRLTNQGRVNRVKISPDGKFFAYTLRERGSYRTEIRVGQTDGGSDNLLRRAVGSIAHFPISFSADGVWLYYVEIPAVSEYKHSTGTFYKMPVLGGAPQKISDSTSVFAVLSPDGKQLVFPKDNLDDRTSKIMVADLDGGNEREILVRPSDGYIDVESLTWSPDGQSVAFAAANGNSRINSSNKSFEVFIASVTDGSVKQLTALEWNRILTLEWLKDGQGIFAVARNSEQFNASSLWLIDYPSGKTQRVSRDVNRYAGVMSSTADSRALAVVQSEIECNLWLAPADNLEDTRQITFSSSGRQDGWHGVDFAPDGRIVYTAWIDESLTLWMMESDGSNSKQLTSIGFRDEKPTATADGRFIVFQSNRSGATEIWRMDRDSAHLQPLTTTGGNTYPSVTPDGMWVVYRHALENEASLWRVPLAGGEPVQITDKNVIAPRASPDGKTIAGGISVDGQTRLALFSIEGGEPLRSFDVPDSFNFRTIGIRWSPDGSFISYPDSANGIWRQDLSGGAPVRLEGIPVEKTFSFAWSRDGKQLAFGRSREIRDAILLTNFR